MVAPPVQGKCVRQRRRESGAGTTENGGRADNIVSLPGLDQVQSKVIPCDEQTPTDRKHPPEDSAR